MTGRFIYATVGFSPVATPTDIFTLAGDVGTLVRIRRVVVSGMATTAGFMPINLIRRSTPNTGGTSSAPTPSKKGTRFPDAAEAVLALYTANPTGLGTPNATFLGQRLFTNLVGNQHDSIVARWDEGLQFPPEIGANEWLCLNMLGATLPAGAVFDFSVEWDEE